MELRFNLERREVAYKGRTERLSPFEYQILWLLNRSVRDLVTEAYMMSFLYDERENDIPLSNVVQVVISRLRGKLKRITDDTWKINNEHGFGYRLEPPD